ncbi:DNA excision repair protein ERCC-5 homolog [Palaemon carinicauda]|uniref:DNA excision repair protein ERCC-5 homolog n=1 Tax=Palaemon carinicauda TaxID=392227 RepID=UPI0035B62A21
MGVKGLWKLIECSGVPVPLETLEHKILAVDVSIWLHQAVRGFRGPGGAAVANAHLLTLFHRICKLLFYRIRPVFVFDGGVPHLKKQTLASRRLRREVAASKAKQVRERLLANLMKSQAVRKALGRTGPGPSTAHVIRPKKVQKDMFELPPLPEEGKDLIKSEPVEEKSVVKAYTLPNLHQFEFESEDFKALPLEAQHEILSELQTTRKENSWSTLNEMPQESKTFAQFQMERLMKRYKFQSTLDDIRTEMQKKKAAEMETEMFGELEKHVSLTQRIVSEDAAHSIYIKKINDTKNEPDMEENVFKQESKEKTSKRSREEFEKDFLTELEKQGIVKAKHMSDSESDSDVDDDYYDFSDIKNKEGGKQGDDKLDFDGKALLKVVSSLLDNDGLSQEEILTLIKQGNPDEQTHKMPVSTDGPSTSGKASGFVFNPDVDSSDDDSDFIEVSEPNSPGVLTTEKIDETNDEGKVDNVKKVLETKNNSLWIKIMQQRLDDLVHSDNTSTSPKKARVDSRSMGPPVQKNTNKPVSDKSKSISISLDFDIAPLKMEDDIFADVFSEMSDKSSSLETKPSPEKKRHSNLDAITRKLSRYTDVQSKREKSALANKASVLKGNEASKIESNLPFSSKVSFAGVTQNSKNIKKIGEVQSENKELGKEKNSEVEFMSSSDDSDSEKFKGKKNLKIPEKTVSEPVFRGSNAIAANYDDEAEVDDVEIMSSSGDSDSETEKKDGIKEPKEDSPLKKSELIVRSERNQGSSNSPSEAADHVKEITDEKDVQESNISSLQSERVEEDKSIKRLENIEKGDMSTKKVVALPSTSTGGKNATLDDQDSSKSVEQIASSSDGERKSKVNGLVVENYDAKSKETTHKAELVNLEQGVAVVENKSSSENETSPSTPNNLQEKAIDSAETNENDLVEPERPLDYSEDELKRLEGELAEEQKALVAQAQKVERISSNLNDQMYGESQHLLQLFGIPYLVAPMEAEAQCGFLDAFNLTSGTITDDSDIFLFGGTKVYKNFFNQAKHVEFFKTDNIIANLGLNRDKMITLALLTGSDYTEGIESVGAVSAMEVLTEFPGEGIECLKAFKKWWNVAHKNVSAIYLSKVKQKMAQVHLPESFPSENIFKAYLEPEVDESKERFSWAVPNVDALRLFTMEKFGWNRAKADEILLPVMKKLGIKTTQMRIDSFFTNIKLVKDEKVHSKRMQDAIAKAKGEEPPSAKEAALKRSGNLMRKKPPAKRRKVQPSEESLDEDIEQEEVDEIIPVKKPSRTLLIDPSEGSSGPEVPMDKPKAKGRGRKKKEDTQEKKSGGPSRAMREVEEDYVPPRKLTKEIMYEALLKKQTISQREVDKQKMEDKKKLAAELLKKTASKGKKNR